MAGLPLQSSIVKAKPTTLMLGGLLFVAFLDTFTQLPLIAPFAQALGAEGLWVGLIVGAYSVTNAVGNVLAGWVLDHVGRRLPLCIGFLGAGIAVASYGTSGSPGILFGIRSIHGLVGGLLVPTVFTIHADWTNKKERRKSSGRIGMSIGIAALVGPMIAGILGDRLGIPTVFTIVGTLLAITGVLSLRWTFLDHSPEASTDAASAEEAEDAPSTWSNEALKLATTSALLLTTCLGALTVLLPLLLSAAGYSSAATGAAFSSFAVTAMFVMLVGNRMTGMASQGVGVGFAAISVAFSVLALSPGLGGSVVAMGVFGIGFGFLFPTLNALVANGNSASTRGRSYGVFYAGFSGGFIIAPPVVGWVLDNVGSVWVFIALALVTLCATIGLWRQALE